MNRIDYTALDAKTLRTFLTVLEESSVSRAAERLGVTQSAVSHAIDKLREILNDPLFVRMGRGIEPTARAHELRKPIESILDNMRSLTEKRHFDPLAETMAFTVAANDFPIQLIFPPLLKALDSEGVDIQVRFISSGIPTASLLRASRYQLLITPTPPKDPQLMKASLLQSKMAIFYDAQVRKPPTTWKRYLDCKRVEVGFSDTESAIMALKEVDLSRLKPPVISVPNFGVLADMISGTERITTQLDIMKRGLLGQLEVAPLPISTKPVDLFLIWHRREDDDPAHRWFRERILDSMKSILVD